MGWLDWTLTPVLAAGLVGAIGFLGLIAAVIAISGIGRERSLARRGREALRDLPRRQAPSFDYRQWINERKGIANSHFADHLLAASAAAQSGRAVTLQELHEVSVRREARRLSARLSSGVTTLLLVCGIAGTLWCIKPVLGGFDISANPEGEFEAAKSAQTATRLLQDLSRAFWPSLVALVFTVFVAFARGYYAHARGVLAGELDSLDLDELFSRFENPSVSRELDEVRRQLADLVTQMVASQRNFDSFVDRLSGAASDFGAQAPPLQDASKRFVEAAGILSSGVDGLCATLTGYLGATSPLCTQLGNVGSEIKGANKALREDIKQTIDAVALELLEHSQAAKHDMTATYQTLREDITRALQLMAQDLRTQGDAMEQDFRQAIGAAIATITVMHNSATEAIEKAARAINRLEQLQKEVMDALEESSKGRQEMALVRTDVQSAVAQIGMYSRQLQDGTTELLGAQTVGRTLIDQLTNIVPTIDRLTEGSSDLRAAFEGLKASQETTVQRVGKLLTRAEKAGENWQALVAEMTQLSKSGATLSAEFRSLLAKGQEIASQLERGAADAARQQEQLVSGLAALNGELANLERETRPTWITRLFRRKRKLRHTQE